MLKNVNRYIKTVIEIEKILKDLGNEFRFVAQRKYNGKPEAGLLPGANVTLQVTQDHSEPIIDKTTGLPKDNNILETFDATIVGCEFPLPFSKGDLVSLGGFIPEASYFIDYSLILRLREIKLIKKQQAQGGNSNAPTGKE